MPRPLPFLAAACLSGGRVTVPGLSRDSAQGDVRIVEHLRAFGCGAGFDETGAWAEGSAVRGASVDLGGEPDLAPVLVPMAVSAARRVGATSKLTGLGTLEGKESPRLSVLAGFCRSLGCAVEASPDALVIGPSPRATGGGAVHLEGHGDHRMVFAALLLGLAEPGVRVSGHRAVAKSWARALTDLEGLGLRFDETRTDEVDGSAPRGRMPGASPTPIPEGPVLVTGGAGYVGSHAVRVLHAAGVPVAVLDNLSEGHRDALPREVPFFEGDLLEPERLAEVMGIVRPRSILHFAALCYVGDSVREPERYHRVNVGGTRNLVHAAPRRGSRVRLLLDLCDLRRARALPLGEDHPQRPIVPTARPSSMRASRGGGPRLGASDRATPLLQRGRRGSRRGPW